MQGYTKLIVWLLLLLSTSSSYFGQGSDSDVQCLKDLTQSLIDPYGVLESWWNFTHVHYSICDFTGVECWSPTEKKVLSLRLGNLGLEGSFPRGLELCTSMITLDLSGNKLSGPLPERISDQLPYLTKLDLSNNSFSGEIPAGIANMMYLKTLLLQDNQFEGRIPALILSRLEDNSPSGFLSSNFTGNPGLCGPPLDKKCKNRVRLPRINDASSIGAAAGFVVGFVVAFYFPHRFLFCRRLRPYVFPVCA